jgi:hypothetical protein
MNTPNTNQPVSIAEETTELPGRTSETRICDALRASPDLIPKLIEVIESGLQATKWSWDIVAKCKVEEPDHKERREMAKLALAYLEGLPAQTVVNLNAEAKSQPRLADVLRNSPNARRAIEGLLSRLPD